jgi:hypothetical protein
MRSLVSAAVLSFLALGAAAVAQVPAAYTVEPFTPASTITIQGSGVRLRAEPFANQQTQVLSTGSTGLPLTVVGIARLPDWNWYQVILKSGQKAFIRSDLTSAPSRGGQTSVALAPVVPATPAPSTPQPVTLAPVAPAPITTPPPYASTTYNRPATPQPAYTPPPFTPAPAPSIQPASPNEAPISLVPRSALPALQPGSPESDPSGLQSVPPRQ